MPRRDRSTRVLSLREQRVTRAGGTPEPADAPTTLAETLDRVLARGIVAQAEVVLTVAEIPLVYVGLQALVASVETAAGLAHGSERGAPNHRAPAPTEPDWSDARERPMAAP